jgi:cell wall-associated NlpC family hydrolase
VATPRPALGHALDRFPAGSTAGRRPRPSAWIRSGLLLGTIGLTVGLLPGTASADPVRATSPEQAAQLVAEANQQLEIITEQVNTAQAELDQQRAVAAAADKAAADAQAQLATLDGQIRQIARSAYTGGSQQQFATLDVLMTSESADQFLAQLGTLNAIAGHTVDVLRQATTAAQAAAGARQQADAARDQAQRTLDEVTAKQADLQADIADYQKQYDALSVPQRQQVDTANAAHGGQALAAPAAGSVVAASGAARAAGNTALAQVGDPYVWGASGPNAFDCSGLTQYAFAAAGISLPHSSSMQARMGTPVSRSQLQPGDLIFFYSPVSHVAMYIGNGQMVHASTAGQPVKVVSVGSMPGYNSARRLG